MKAFFKPLFALLLLSLVVGCDQEEYAFGDIQAPTNLSVTAEVVGQSAENPFGDGSGIVRFTATGDNTINYRFDFSDGTTNIAPGGMLEKRFTQVGVNNYEYSLVASGTAGVSSSLSGEVEVLSDFSDPDLLDFLTGDGSKTWYWAADEPGHLGVGPNNDDITQNYFPFFYQAVPFEKDGADESLCLYQDELVFSRQGDQLFYQLNNFGQTYFNVGYEGVAGGAEGFDFCYSFDVNESPNPVSLGPSESFVVGNNIPGQTTGTQLNFSEGDFMSYYIGTTTYEVISVTNNRLVVRGVQGNNDFLAWYHIFSSTKPSLSDDTDYDNLVWSDEFDVDGPPNPENWGYNIGRGNNGWGNGESQYYTDRPENVRVENGNLIITAQREVFSGADYTSARITTEDKFEFTFGRIDIRAKLPIGGGTWPALWMLGEDYATNTWPACGEIDIMEHVGNQQNTIFSSLHFPGNSGGDAVSQSIVEDNVSTEFHEYSAIWSPETIRFFVDGVLYHTFANSDGIPFNDDFFLIFNVAMGGNFGGNIDPAFNSSSMEVDYVRVYQ